MSCVCYDSTLHHNDVIPDTENSIDGFSLFCFSLPFMLLLRQHFIIIATLIYGHCLVVWMSSSKFYTTIIIVSLINVAIIMRIDTGQQLDIVYMYYWKSPCSHINRWAHLYNLFSSESQPLCSTPNTTGNPLVAIITLAGIGLVSGYIAAVHVISCDLSRAMQYLWKADGGYIQYQGYCFGRSVH